MSFIEINTKYIYYGKLYVFFVSGFITALYTVPTEALSVSFYPLPRIFLPIVAAPAIGYVYVKLINRSIDNAYKANDKDTQ